MKTKVENFGTAYRTEIAYNKVIDKLDFIEYMMKVAIFMIFALVGFAIGGLI